MTVLTRDTWHGCLKAKIAKGPQDNPDAAQPPCSELCGFCKATTVECFYCGEKVSKSQTAGAWVVWARFDEARRASQWIALHHACARELGIHLVQDSFVAFQVNMLRVQQRDNRQDAKVLGLRRTLEDIVRWSSDPRVREAAKDALRRHQPERYGAEVVGD